MIFKLRLIGGGYDRSMMVREVVEFVDDVGAGLGVRTSASEITAGMYGDI